MQLYASEYLSGWELDWIVGRRLVMEDQFIKLLLEMACFYREEGKYGEEIKWLKQGLAP